MGSRFKKTFKLQEIPQDYFTRISFNNNKKNFNNQNNSRSLPPSLSSNAKVMASRLDRTYISFDLAEYALTKQTLTILDTFKYTTPPSDHIPITSSFVNKKKNLNKAFQIPDWVLNSTHFQTSFRNHWKTNFIQTSSFSDIKYFQKTLTKLAKQFLKNHTCDKSTPLEILNSALGLLREVTQTIPDPQKNTNDSNQTTFTKELHHPKFNH